MFKKVKFSSTTTDCVYYVATDYYALLHVAAGKLKAQATSQNTSSGIALCPGEVLIVECSITGGGATVWQGNAIECDSNSRDLTLRHSQFGELQKPTHTISCGGETVIAKAIGVVNNSYVSELNITVNRETNNTSVECVHSYNLTETVVKAINISIISDIPQIFHPTDVQLSDVTGGELTFHWNPRIKSCNNSLLNFYYFIESEGCGNCPHETYDNHVTCKNASSINKLCSITIGANTTDGIWKDQGIGVNITLRGENNNTR